MCPNLLLKVCKPLTRSVKRFGDIFIGCDLLISVQPTYGFSHIRITQLVDTVYQEAINRVQRLLLRARFRA